MAALIKNQILKHLSKFTKNLSPDKINLSALKGEGDLTNLELNEDVLTELLSLPTWLRLSRAFCNRVTIKIQWTKLGSQPICLYMDEVTVEMETCAEPRAPTTAAAPSYSSGGKYGFVEKIADGISLSVNSVVVSFKSHTFKASIQLSRVSVQSKTPVWQDGELPTTRLKNELVGEVMIFKEAQWQTLRIEANALTTDDPLLSTTPLRLIANQSKVRIVVKKRLSDCSVVSSKLQVNLDDLLWVLTDSQLTAALSFANALLAIIANADKQTKKLIAAQKLQKQNSSAASTQQAQLQLQRQQQQKQQQQRQQHLTAGNMQQPAKQGSKTQQRKAEIFDKYNIVETSYHIHTGRIDLHLCDDSSPETCGYKRKVEGGAIQLVLSKLQFDLYPLHRAGLYTSLSERLSTEALNDHIKYWAPRDHWMKFDENMTTRNQWASKLLDRFKQEVRTVKGAYTSALNDLSVSNSNEVKSLQPTQSNSSNEKSASSFRSFDGSIILNPATVKPSPVTEPPKPAQVDRKQFDENSSRASSVELLESCVIVRLEDFALYRVSTSTNSSMSGNKKRNQSANQRRFLSSDKKTLLLPREMSSIHMEFTDYYFPEGKNFPDSEQFLSNADPSECSANIVESVDKDFVVFDKVDIDAELDEMVPPANLYVMINPLCLSIDYLTLVWLNAFLLNLSKKANLESDVIQYKHSDELPKNTKTKIHVDIRVDALMPRIAIPASDVEIEGTKFDQSECLQVQMSKVVVTNTRTDQNKSSRQDLATFIHSLHPNKIFTSESDLSVFPHESDDWENLFDQFIKHTVESDDAVINKLFGSILREAALNGIDSSSEAMMKIKNDLLKSDFLSQDQQKVSDILKQLLSKDKSHSAYDHMKTDSLYRDAQADVWCVMIEQLWVDFVTVTFPPVRNPKTKPFIESFPVTLWFVGAVPDSAENCQVIPSSSSSSSGGEPVLLSQHYEKVKHGSLVESRAYHSVDVEAEKSAQTLHNNLSVIPSSSMPDQFSQSMVNENNSDVLRNPFKKKNPTDKTENIESSGIKPDIHILVNIESSIRLQLTHSHFCLLMTLIDTVKCYKLQAEEDVVSIMNISPAELELTAQRMLLWTKVGEIEVSLIFPEIPEYISSHASKDSVEEDDTDPLTNNGNNISNGDCDTAIGSESPLSEEIKSADHTESKDLQQNFLNDVSGDFSISDTPPSAGLLIDLDSDASVRGASMLDSGADEISQLSTGSTVPVTNTPDSLPSVTCSSDAESETLSVTGSVFEKQSVTSAQNLPLVHKESPELSLNNDSRDLAVPASVKTSSSSTDLRKSFNNALTNFSKFTDKVKPSAVIQRASRQFDDSDSWDTASQRSYGGYGSDDEDDGMFFERLADQSELPAFERHHEELGADESMDEGVDGSEQNDSSSASAVSVLISVFKVRVRDIEAIVQSRGQNTSVIALVKQAALVELGNQVIEKFQSSYILGGKDGVDWDTIHREQCGGSEDPLVRLRFELGDKAERASPGAAEIGYLRAVAGGLKTKLKSTTLSFLGEFFDDNKPPVFLPMDIEASNISLTIIDDKMPVYTEVPKMMPVDVSIQRVFIRRDGLGVFHIAVNPMSELALSHQSSSNYSCTLQTSTSSTLQPDRPHVIAKTIQSKQREDGADESADKSGMLEELTRLRGENETLRVQLEKIGELGMTDQSDQSRALREENEKLMQQLTQKANELLAIKEERESLLLMFQKLQEDLEASEKRRSRSSFSS